jgi:hypothetical protein
LLDLRALSLGVLVPGLIVGIGLAGVWRPWKPGPPPKKSFFALFSAIAFFVSYSLLLEVPPHPFGERTLAGLDWLLWIALLSAPLFLMEGAGKALALRSLSAAAMLAGLLRAMVVHHWSPGMAVLWLGGAALSLALLWIVGAGLNERVEGATMPLVLLVSATGLALAAGLNGSVLLGQTTGILCASLGAATILGFWHPCFRLRSGDVCFALSGGWTSRRGSRGGARRRGPLPTQGHPPTQPRCRAGERGACRRRGRPIGPRVPGGLLHRLLLRLLSARRDGTVGFDGRPTGHGSRPGAISNGIGATRASVIH